MARELELFDGTVLEFPDETTDDVMVSAGRRETTRLRDAQARRPLPIDVTPSNAGAGRGTQGAAQTAEDAQQRAPRPRRGGVRSEVRPYGAGDERIVAPPPVPEGGSVFDRAAARGQEIPDLPMTPEQGEWLSLSPAAQAEALARQQYHARAAAAPEARPADAATNMGAAVREFTDNPVARGAAAGLSQLGQVGVGAVRMGAEAVGADGVADFARGASGAANTVAAGAMQGLRGNDQLAATITSSIINSAPAVALGTIGGPALRTLFAQSAAADYAETGNLAHAGIMGAAEALGERFGFPEQIRLLKGVVKGMPADDVAKVLGALIAKEIPGEQATTAMQFLADKFGPGARNPNATFADYLKQAGETLEVTIGQTAVMGGGPAALTTARDQMQRADAATERSAMNPAERAASDAGFSMRPTQRLKAATDRLDDFGATHGISSKAIKALKDNADGMPVDEVPGFFKRAIEAMSRRGLVRRPVGEAELGALDEQPSQAVAEPQGDAIEAPELVADASISPSAVSEPPARTPIDDGAHVAATSPENDLAEPTEAQQKAGNYKVGRARIAGMDISIENPEGSVRRGVDADGTPWENTMRAHYGYVRGSEAKDGDHVDVFIKPGTPEDYAGPVFVVDQIDPKTGKYDEAKAIIGAADQAEAEAIYRSNYAADWKGLGAITGMPIGAFKAWAASKEARKPLGDINAARTAGDGAPGAADAGRGDGGQLLRDERGALAVDARGADEPDLRGARPDAVRPAGDTARDDALNAAAQGTATGVNAGARPSAEPRSAAPGAAAPSRVIARAGRTPNAAQPLELRANPDGTLTPYMEGSALNDYDSGNPIVLPADVTDLAAKQAIRKAGAVSNRTIFYPPKAGDQAAAPTQDATGERGGERGDTAAVAAAPRTLDVDGRASDRKPIMPGDTFATASGRQTTPYPKQRGEKYASQWLIDNAIAEAKSRGDDFNSTAFSGETILKSGALPTASRDSMLEYLFGEQPRVAPKIMRPLGAPATAAPVRAADTKEQADEEGLQGQGRRQEALTSPVQSQGAAGRGGPAASKARLTPLDDDRLKQDDFRTALQQATADIGWTQRGGQLIRSGVAEAGEGNGEGGRAGAVIGRTQWLGPELWRERPDGISEQDAREGIAKALAGEPLTAKQKRWVQYVLERESDRVMRDRENAAEAAAERAAIMAEAGIGELGMQSLDDSDIPFDYRPEAPSGQAQGPTQGEDAGKAGRAEEAQPAEVRAPDDPGSAEARADEAGEGLTAPTPESLRAADERARTADTADRKEQKRLADKAKADAEVGEFTLTGSDSARDVAAAAGQGDLLDAPAPAAAAPAMPTARWVIKERGTGKIIMETFDRKKVDALNTEKYEAVPIGEHLASLNRKPEAASPADQRPVFMRSLDAVFIPGTSQEVPDGWTGVAHDGESKDGGFVHIRREHDGTMKAVRLLDREVVEADRIAQQFRAVPESQASAPPAAPATPKASADRLDAESKLWTRINAGRITPSEFKAGFEAWVRDKVAITEAMAAKKKDELLRAGGAWFASRYKSDTKPEIIDALWRQGASAYTLGKSFQYGMGKDSYINGIRTLVEATDEKTLADHVDDLKKAREEAAARVAKVAEAIKDPKTLDDYRTWMRAQVNDGKTVPQARLMLTPEQRATFDLLLAEESRGKRKVQAEERREVRVAGQTVDGQIIATKHTKKGHDLFVVRLSERVSREDYETLNAGAKKIGGYYSSYRGGGAIPGFQFTDRAQAEAFVKLAGGDQADAQAAAQQRRDAFEDDRSQTAAERLTTMADALEERADASLARDRKTNTDRRARMAAAAEADAEASKAMARTMRNIAAAIEAGSAKFLDRVRQKVQVELLQRYVRSGHDAMMRAKYPAYIDYEKHRHDAPSTEAADFTEFPSYTAYRSDLAGIARQLLEVDGAKQLGQKLMKLADDVSDAYVAFAKEPGNLFKLSTFSVRRGDEQRTAIFPDKGSAERAIKRSGLTGVAIVLPEKRGVNRIIMSPSEAIKRGLWQGDGDKRITLDPDVGAELVEKLGRAARRNSRLAPPWQFERAYDDRKVFARMGIETPAEMRSALREFVGLREQAKAPDKVKTLERAMVGRRNDGFDFFPTPEATADEMVAAAGLAPGMTVLEPSAGWGHIAERIREAGVEPDVVEISEDRRELLEAKGFKLVGRDFLQVTEGGYDRILMNPPFSDGRDIEHVRHAYSLLKPGGRLVAIVGEGAFSQSFKRAAEFREWLDSVGGTEEKLAKGTFADPSLPVTTSANARMVVIDKGEGGDTRFSLGPPTEESNAAEALSRDDDLFALPRSRGLTVESIAADIDPGITVKAYPSEGLDRYELTMPDGAKASLFVRQASPYGAHSYGHDFDEQGEMTAAQTVRPGRNPDWVPRETDDVWIDVSKLKTGTHGHMVYAIAGAFAHNTGRMFIADPVGLSDEAMRRRSEAMLSLALRHGTSDFLAPHPRQVTGSKALKIPPLEWDYKDDLGNIRRLVDLNVRALDNAVPSARSLEFDVDAGRFRDTITGEFVSRDELARRARLDRAAARSTLAPGAAGSRTLARAAVWRALLRDEGAGGTGRGQRDGLLARLAGLGSAGRDALKGLFSLTPGDTSTGLTVSGVQAAVDELTKGWKNAPPIVVVQDMADPRVPATTRAQLRRMQGDGATGMPKGFFHGNTAYLVADELPSRDDVARVVFHEVLGHHGLRGVFGDSIDNVLRKMTTAMPEAVRAKARSYGLLDDSGQYRSEGAKLLAAEEVLAELAETRPSSNWVQRAIAAIREWLRQNVPGLKLAMTEADVIAQFIVPARRFVERGARAEGLRLATAFSLAGKTDSAAFKRWFGDSKVVDKDGKPLVVYHGSPRGAVDFAERERGMFFTSSARVADDYSRGNFFRGGSAPALTPVYLSIRNPLVIDALGKRNDNIPVPWAQWKPKVFGALPKDAVSVEAAFKRAIEQGHDGLIVRNVVDTNATDGTDKGDVYAVARPEQIKSAIGNRGTFDPNDADVRFSLGQPPLAGVPTMPPPPAPPRQGSIPASGAPGPRSVWSMPEGSKLDNAIYKFQDKNVDLKRATDAIRAEARAIGDRFDAYLQEELYHGRAAARVEDFAENELRPLIAEMKLRAVTQERLSKFLHARHAQEANELIAERGGLEDGGSGMTTADAKAFLDGLDPAERKRLDAVASKVDAMIAKTREVIVGYGLESRDTVDGWADMFRHYVPLQREEHDGEGMGIGQGFSIRGKEAKHRTGSTAAVSDILANVALQRERAIVRGEKNRVAVATVGLALTNPNPDVWKVEQPPTEQVLNPTTQQIETRTVPGYKSLPNVLVAKIKDGKGDVAERVVVFNDGNERAMRMATALKNLDAEKLEGWVAVSAKITRYFASINTQYNPVFGFTNLVRDLQGAAINLASTPLAGQQAAVLAQASKFLAEAAAAGFRMDGIKDQALWKELQREGGTTGYRDLYRTTEDRANAIKRELDPHAWMREGYGRVLTANAAAPARVAQNVVTSLFDWLSDFNESLENVTRLAAYKVAIDQGLSRQRAASLAKNLTVNFNRGGAQKPLMGAMYAFFNAAMQGTARIAQTLFEMKGGDVKTLHLTRVGKAIVAGGITIGVLQALALAAAGFEDDDIPDFVKQRNLILPLPGTEKKYLTIPMPLGWHVLPNMGRTATELAIAKGKDASKRGIEMFGLFLDAFNPLGGSGTVWQILSPTVFDPMVALLEDKDWTGRPIARKSYDSVEPGFKNAREAASAPARWIAEGVNRISGGTEFVRGKVSPTPDQIDYLIGQATGGVGRELAKASAMLEGARTGETVPTHKIPLLGRFYGDASQAHNQSSRFYDALTRMREHQATIEGLAKQGRRDELDAYLKANPEAAMAKAAEMAGKKLSELRAARRLLVEKGQRERVKQVEKQITEYMTTFNKKVDEAQKPRTGASSDQPKAPARATQELATTN